MQFRFVQMRAQYLARRPIRFPAAIPANLLRGRFGYAFREIACDPRCADAASCPRRSECVYAAVFEPVCSGGPSGLRQPPRPFTFRARHLDGRTIPPREIFHFTLNIFDLRAPRLDWYARACERLFGDFAVLMAIEHNAVSVFLDPPPQPVERIRVEFLSPTELKSAEQLVTAPDFDVLMARVRDRIAALSDLYGEGPLAIDFAAFASRAAKIRMTSCQLQTTSVSRRSSRTGRQHPLGGFTGSADYEGELTEFVPYLQAAQHTGLGRQTTWGKGEIFLHLPA